MIRVTVKKDGELIQSKDVRGAEVIFGREREADIQLFGPAVSRRHARLQKGMNGWQIADLGAANGVYVVRPGKDPQRVVIEDVTEADHILIEAFTVSFEMRDDDADTFDGVVDLQLNEDSLETKRTQFISMQEVLEGTDVDKLKASGADPRLVAQAERLADGSSGQGRNTGPVTQPKISTVSSEQNVWWAKMESTEGHRRVFELSRPHVTVGASAQCDIALPSGPPMLLEADRSAGTVSIQRVARWPFPRVKIDGNVVKEAMLNDGDSFMVGKVEVTFSFSEPST